VSRGANPVDPSQARSVEARFSELRAASRALERLLGSDAEEPRRLAEAITELSDQARIGRRDQSDQAELHAQLDAAEASVRTRLGCIAPDDLRRRIATSSADAGGDPLALLDVLLGEDGGADACRAAVECLVTLLATEVRGGRRVATRDPGSLSPRLARRLRETTVGQGDPEAAEVERALLEATQRLDREEPDAIDAEVAGLRSRLGPTFWNPIVLRALVYYNARSWRRWERSPVSPHEGLPRHDVAPPAHAPPATARASESTGPVRVGAPDNPPETEPASHDDDWPVPTPASRDDDWPVPTPASRDDASLRQARPTAADALRNAPPPAPNTLSATDRPARVIASAGLGDWKIPASPPRPRPAPVRTASRRPSLRLVALALATALLAWAGLGDPSGDVEVLGHSELRALSPWLEEGYRSVAGERSLFVGSFEPAWESLTPEEREESARELTRQLRAAGVAQILVYDRDRRVRVQVARGLPMELGG